MYHHQASTVNHDDPESLKVHRRKLEVFPPMFPPAFHGYTNLTRYPPSSTPLPGTTVNTKFHPTPGGAEPAGACTRARPYSGLRPPLRKTRSGSPRKRGSRSHDSRPENPRKTPLPHRTDRGGAGE